MYYNLIIILYVPHKKKLHESLIDHYMPASFKEQYPSTRVVIDCTEIYIQHPANPTA